MKIISCDDLSDIKLDVPPLTVNEEGQLVGGFIGIEGHATDSKSNEMCENDGCVIRNRTNNGCLNTNCQNISCINNGCTNRNTEQKTRTMLGDPCNHI